MVRELSICAAGALLALAQIAGLHARAEAQHTDGQVLIGGGLEPLSLAWTRTEIEGRPESTTRTTHWGPSGEVLLVLGYGLGPWVLALETAFGSTIDTTEQVDIVSSASMTEHTISRATFVIGPTARLLFGQAAVRPFVEAGVGLALDRVSAGESESDSLGLYAQGGPGLQVRLADSVSIDVALRIGYTVASGTLDPDVRVFVLDRAGSTVEIGPSEFSSSALDLATTARLSVWL